jgi:hypothetical protein
MSASRRVPDLVNTATLDAYYVANPEKAINRSPDRVGLDFGHQKNVKPPTWLPGHLSVYAFMTFGFTFHPLFFFSFLFSFLLFILVSSS